MVSPSLFGLLALAGAWLLLEKEADAGAYDTGNWGVVEWDIGDQLSPNISYAPYHIHVWAPTSCSITCGPFKTTKVPVLLFISAFAAQVSIKLYSEIFAGVAAQGIVVVGVDQKPLSSTFSADYNKLAALLEGVEKYILGTTAPSLTTDMASKGCKNAPSLDKIFIGGHSAGVHVALSRVLTYGDAQKDCARYGGVVMLSPVDGDDPFGLNRNFVISDSASINFIAPAVMIWGSLDSASSDTTKGLSCAPAFLANDHFYNNWRGTIYSIQATGIGHLDFLNKGSFTTFDSFCKTAATDDVKQSFRLMTKGAITSFIFGLAASQATGLTSLGDATYLKFSPVSLKQKTGQKNTGTSFGCVWDVLPDPLKYEVQTGIYLGIGCCLGVFFGGLFIFIRRVDKDNQEDWLVKIETSPMVNGDGSSPMIVSPGQAGFNLGTTSLKRDIYDDGGGINF